MRFPVVLIFLILSSCVSDGVTDNAVASDIYFKSQAEADMALDAFDKENPSCQLWTNWQKMCSRTGPDGVTLCTTDPDALVRPSTPFCSVDDRKGQRVKQVGATIAWLEWVIEETAASRKSRNRFCDTFHSEDPNESWLKNGAFTLLGDTELCKRYKVNRPFNGRSPKLASHPYCNKWSKFDSGLYYCAAPKPHAKCDDVSIGFTRPKQLANGLIIEANPIGQSQPIYGMYCKQEIEQ